MIANRNTNCPQHKILRVAGLSIIVMAVLAAVSMGLFFGEALTLKGESLLAFYHTHTTNYRIAVVSWLAILACDFIASVCFYEAYRYNRPFMGRIAAQLRFVYTAFLLFGILRLFSIWNINPGTDNIAGVEQAIYGFQSLWFLGLVIFGLHLMGLSILTPTNNKLLVAIKFLLLTGGIGYIILHGGDYMIPNFEPVKKLIEPVLVAPMVLGELGLALYMAISPRKLANSFA